METFQPQYLATALSDSRHADCDTLLQKMLEVVPGGEHSNLNLLLCRNIFCISVSQDFFLPFYCTKRSGLATFVPSLVQVGQCAWELGLPNGRKCHFLSDPCVF